MFKWYFLEKLRKFSLANDPYVYTFFFFCTLYSAWKLKLITSPSNQKTYRSTKIQISSFTLFARRKFSLYIKKKKKIAYRGWKLNNALNRFPVKIRKHSDYKNNFTRKIEQYWDANYQRQQTRLKIHKKNYNIWERKRKTERHTDRQTGKKMIKTLSPLKLTIPKCQHKITMNYNNLKNWNSILPYKKKFSLIFFHLRS